MIKKRISAVFIIIGFSFFFGFLKQVFLARELTKTELGNFSLFMTIIAFIYPITLLGKQNSLVRFFSRENIQNYDWKNLLYRILIVSVVLCTVFLLVTTLIYKIQIGPFIFIFIALCGSVIADLYTSIMRSEGHFEKSIFWHRSVRFSFPVVLLIIYLIDDINLKSVLIGFSIIYIIYIFTVIVLTNTKYPNGTEKVPSRIHTDGLFFLGSDISLLVVANMDRFIIAKILPIEDLAIYFSIYTIMRIYELLYQAIEYVLLPYSNKFKNTNIIKLCANVFLIGMGITVFYIFLGPKVVHLVYDGKYDSGISLIPLFCALGLVRILYSIPYSFIGGKLKQIALKYLLYSNLGIVLINIVVGIIFTSLWQLKGAVLSTIFVWMLRTCCAFLIFYRFRNHPVS